MSSALRQGDALVLPPAPQAPAPLVPGRFWKPTTPAEQAAIQAAVTRVWVEHQGRGRGASPTRGTPRPACGRSTGSPRQGRITPRPAAPDTSSPTLWLPSSPGSSLLRTWLCQPLREPGRPPQRLSRRDSYRRFPSRDRVVGGIPGAPALRWSGPPLTASSRRPTNSWLQWGGGKSLPGTMSTTRTTPNGLTRPSRCTSPVPSRGAPKFSPSTWTLRGTSSGNTSGEGPPHCVTAPRERSTVLQSLRTTWT